jgi:hypothetical protein
MYRLAIITGVLALLTSCSSLQDLNARPVAMINWADFIKLNGITYLASRPGSGRGLEKADLGPEFASAQFKVSDTIHDPEYQTKDGDTAFLDRGTPIYTVQGYAPEFRLAATRDGQLVMYEADSNANAKLGSDLLDLRDKVQSIGIVSTDDGTTELAAIADAQQVSKLVEQILAAPVDQNRELVDDAGQSYFLEFRFKDGTSTSRMYWLGSGELVRGIYLPAEFSQAIQAAYRPSASITPSADS